MKLFAVFTKFKFPTVNIFTLLAQFVMDAYEWVCSFVFHWPISIDFSELYRLFSVFLKLFSPEFAYQLSWLATFFDFSVDWIIPSLKLLFAALVKLLNKFVWRKSSCVARNFFLDRLRATSGSNLANFKFVWRQCSCVVARNLFLDRLRATSGSGGSWVLATLSLILSKLGVFLDQLSNKSMFMVPRPGQSPEADSEAGSCKKSGTKILFAWLRNEGGEHEECDALVNKTMRSRKDTVHVVMDIFNPMTRRCSSCGGLATDSIKSKTGNDEICSRCLANPEEKQGVGAESEDQQGPQPTGRVFELVHGIALERFTDKNVKVDGKGTYYLSSDKARLELISHKLVHRFNLADSSQPGTIGKSSHDERLLVIDEAFICCFSYRKIACRDLH